MNHFSFAEGSCRWPDSWTGPWCCRRASTTPSQMASAPLCVARRAHPGVPAARCGVQGIGHTVRILPKSHICDCYIKIAPRFDEAHLQNGGMPAGETPLDESSCDYIINDMVCYITLLGPALMPTWCPHNCCALQPVCPTRMLCRMTHPGGTNRRLSRPV